MKRFAKCLIFAGLIAGLISVPIARAQFETRVRNSDDIDFIGAVTVRSDVFQIKDQSDSTKKLKFDLSGITTGTTRTFTAPNASGTMVTSATTASRQILITADAKVGATSGWVVNAANNLGLMATCPAAQTASTLVIPINGLEIGDTITAFYLTGQIESSDAANSTIDADMRKLTAAAADHTDASIGAMTQLATTSTTDLLISSSNARKALSTAEVIAAGETIYILVTATTGANNDIALGGVVVEVTRSVTP